jgi:FkbM family methyltransferase
MRALRGTLRPLRGGRHVDEMAVVHRLLRDGPRDRVMVDVGGHHGHALEPFALDHWVVHAFEPDPVNRRQLERRWGGWPGVRIDDRALSDREAASAPFYRSAVSDGISSLHPFHPSHTQGPAVAVTTLAAYTLEAGLDRVDLLKVDAEGHDLNVLKGVPWERIQPGVVVCEFDEGKGRSLPDGYQALGAFLVGLEYLILVSEWEPIVEYGRNHRWRRFVQYPAALLDAAAWGNLIAVRDSIVFDRLLRLAMVAGKAGARD